MNIIALLLPAALTFQAPADAARDATKFDGNWWLSVSVDHRRGFLWGFTDGSPREVQQRRFSNQRPNLMEQFLTIRAQAS